MSPGQVLPTLGAALPPLFIANVLLAPWVEESLYRGYLLPALQSGYGNTAAVLISCAVFGLLHRTGGYWYMLLTATVVGVPLALLYLWRQDIVAALQRPPDPEPG